MDQAIGIEPRNASGAAGRGGKRRRGAARRVIERKPPIQGWHSSDADEIERRRWRGRTETTRIEADQPADAYFGSYRVRSTSERSYEVEIRSLDAHLNSCGCADHRVNGLGTCKHVEGVLAHLRRRGVRAFAAAARAGSPRVEVFLSRCGTAGPRILWPSSEAVSAPVRTALSEHLTAEGTLREASPTGVAALLRAVEADPWLSSQVKVSRQLEPWLAEAQRRAGRSEARAEFLAEVAAGRETLEVLRHPLLPYQREGMLHLAFGERALLADEMGLGKTAQAIAACELLRRLRGIERVLVVCPASLKGEWQEQIARFSGAATLLVAGPRARRLADYARPAFFTVVNYEQVVSDAADINRIARPEVIVLDEAQRIKNWHTKTARAVKTLQAPHAFVLTGTPLENRIDEIYSIVQYLDPQLLGPLFRFNRDFYVLDERGRPIDYQNLDELARRLEPVMLRRRKRDVETELPGRTQTNYMVGMTEEQRLRYEDYQKPAARLIHQAQRRPLTKEEFERLQQLLACMRMICDTPYILDPECRVSPKLEELERILGDVLAEPDRKVILFSEWERMLMLVRELVAELGFEFAWHTGSVPQERRRAEIARFKRDPQCRLLLSTDCGSVGLNLQAASAVINLDLPWNPARLEQRIARAWRKNQPRTVDVINLVTEDSIEHSILHLLAQKQAVADGVLDGAADLKSLRMPSGRGAMVERMAAMIGAAPARAVEISEPPEVRLRNDLVTRHGEGLLLLEARRGADGRERFLAVLDGDAATAARERERHAAAAGSEDAPQLEVIDRGSFEMVGRLAAAGLVRMSDETVRELVRSRLLETPANRGGNERGARCAGLLGDAERKLRMALLLAQGGFAEEAAPVLAECLKVAQSAQAILTGRNDVAGAEMPAGPPSHPAGAETPDAGEVATSIERVLAEVRESLRLAA